MISADIAFGKMAPTHSFMKELGFLVLDIRDRGLGIEEKTSNQDIVTIADKAAEKELLGFIEQTFPGDGVIGEEGTDTASESGYTWWLDPIDGTSNFAAGNEFFGISAGREREGVAELGALYFPAIEEFHFAIQGEGWRSWKGGTGWTGSTDLHRTCPISLKEAVIAVGLTKDRLHMFVPLKAACRNVLSFGSFVFEAMLVAKGGLAAYVHTGATPFDCGAALLIAEEHGCVVRNLYTAGSVDLRKPPIPVVIAGNEAIADQIVELFA